MGRTDGGDVGTVEDAIAALTEPGLDYVEAERSVPRSPGLYAFRGTDRAWSDLGLERASDNQPLYVGKAERSLNGRDVGTHFASGRTGSSTVRRSIAALLALELGLVAVPRNLEAPGSSANFALDLASDALLTEWMRSRLSIATWVRTAPDLEDIESSVIRRWRPPLNLAKVGEPRERLRAARAAMAAQARAWTPPPV